MSAVRFKRSCDGTWHWSKHSEVFGRSSWACLERNPTPGTGWEWEVYKVPDLRVSGASPTFEAAKAAVREVLR